MTFSLLASMLVCAAPVKVVAVDESAKDKSFAAFKKALQTAVKTQDAKFVRGALDDKIQAGFGAKGGVKEFLTLLPLQSPTLLWSTLAEVLDKGCARTTAAEFVCPALFAKAPDGFDWFEHSVLKKNAVIRTEASNDAPAVTTRSFEVVKGVRGEDAWAKVQTLDGVSGFALSSDLESPLDTRAFFKRVAGGWRLTFLGAGD